MTNVEYREDEPFARAASHPLRSWRRHWGAGVAALVLGGGLGVAAALLVPVTYTAETRVAVGSGDLTSGAIAGFPLAAGQLASNYARYVNDRGVAGTDFPENVELSASQIPESNVIRIEAKSSDPNAARDSANRAAKELIEAVNSSGSESTDAVLDAFKQAAKADAAAAGDLAAAQYDLERLLAKAGPSATDIRKARADVADAAAKAANTGAQSGALRQKYTNLVAQNSSAAKLQLVRTSDALSANQVSLMARLGLIGLAAGAGLGLVIALWMDRRRPAHARSAAPAGRPDRPAGE